MQEVITKAFRGFLLNWNFEGSLKDAFLKS